MKLKRNYLFGTTILAGVVAMSAPAWAQAQTTEGANATQVDEIVVTGSRIRRDPTSSPTPLIQVQREQLLDTGLSTVIDYLATIPALSNSQVPSDTTGSLNLGGLSLANLRTLGAGRTLTLVDGRRHVGSAGGSLAVDVDTIPRLLIENVEIITGGASSVYGADAVSGVLNFILRKDFEGLEIDARYREVNQDHQGGTDIAALIGHNFLDDRLNVYAFGEWEKIDRVRPADIDWLRRANVLVGNDADTTANPFDDTIDNILYSGVRTLSRPRWGVTVLGNAQQPSATNSPNVPVGACATRSGYADQFSNAAFVAPGSNCFNLQPGQTFVYDNGTARQANFGTRISQTGLNRTLLLDGDGENPNTDFSGDTATPRSESQRYQVGFNFKVTPAVTLFGEAKYVTEQTDLITQPVFGDIIITNSAEVGTRANATSPITYRTVTSLENQPIFNTQTFITRLDNAYLPANVLAAITGNTRTTYGAPTATAPGAPTVTGVASPFARHRFFSDDRKQSNDREVQRYVLGASGELGDIGFVKDVSWDLAYTYGKMTNANREEGVDVLRFGLAQDAVVDTAGLVNGTPGQIVCRARLLAAQGRPVIDYRPSAQNLTTLAYTQDLRTTNPTAISECQPLNVFGKGQQSDAAKAYTFAAVTVHEENKQQDLVGSVSGRLWDFFGAGGLGVAIGGEWRKEESQGVGRDRDTAGRWLFLNTGEDFLPRSYSSKEAFAEISLPLFRDSFLGEYAELSSSYRYSDYDTFGSSDVYGVNLVYRPIRDITFKTSYNTSFRVPTLSNIGAGRTQTFANGFSDPCDARTISNLSDRTIATQRITNCRALAAQYGFTNLTFDFSDTNDLDGTVRYLPNDQGLYGSGSIPGLNAGNPDLKPEQSDSFTFTVGLQPRGVPNLSLVLDYYEIKIDDVIASVSAQTASNLCVNGPANGVNNSLNQQFCDSITRSSNNFIVTTFLQRSFNYAKSQTRGLDFTGRYSIDTEEMFGRNWGDLSFSVRGSWLIEQKNFNNISNPADFTESASLLYYPRVRMTSQVTWAPTDKLSATWTTDWQTAQNIAFLRDFVRNADTYDAKYTNTGNFARNDLTVRYKVREEVTLTAGVTNIFDAEQAEWLGGTLYSNFDPYGRRFNVGINYRPW